MKAEHSKLDGYSATLPAVRPSARLPTATTPLPPPSPCEKPHSPILRPEHLLNRLGLTPHLFHSLKSLPSPQHPQCLSSLSHPSLYLLLVKLVKPFCWMLPSSLQWPCHTYLAWGGVRIRLTGNGISALCRLWETNPLSLSCHV
jgi:hypothetical protein